MLEPFCQDPVTAYVDVMSGSCGSHGNLGGEVLNETKLKDLLHGSEYVLTYEDKDGDWMLVGDVPWEWVLIHLCTFKSFIGISFKNNEFFKNSGRSTLRNVDRW